MASPNDQFDALITDIQDNANDLLDFELYVPNAANISALVAELHAICANLRELQIVSTDPRNIHDTRYYADHKWLVIETLRRTVNDLEGHIGRRNSRPGRSDREIYSSIWRELNDFFCEQGDRTLFDRLNCFKLFLQELVLILRGNGESLDFQLRYDRIDRLLTIQDNDISQQLRRLEIERNAIAAPTKVRSWERKRPGITRERPHIYTYDTNRHHPASPISPSGQGRFWNTAPDPVQPPSPPASTTSTASPSAGSAPSLVASNMANHWLMAAFTQSRPTTDFNNTSAESALFARHASGVTDQLQKNGYAELLILRFDSNIQVRIYLREKDRKARIYCKNEKMGKKIVSCREVSSLNIHRQDSNLRLYEFDKAKKRTMWLILRFPSYERMILFFCAFLALKIEDRSSNLTPDDHILPEEIHVFSCTIYDNHFRHALQIFKDTSSEGIRLQASILEGKKKTAPVWTAFINYKIPARRWINRVERRKIHLADLTRYIFTNDYTAHMGPNGEHEIQFDEEKDADRFEEIIDDLAEKRI